VDADEAAVLAFVFEADNAGNPGEQGVVPANADVNAGLELRTPLSNEN
jgi:hypothetical protein